MPQTGFLPLLGLSTGFLEDPGADAIYQAGPLGNRYEFARRNKAKVRVPPADERLEPQ